MFFQVMDVGNISMSNMILNHQPTSIQELLHSNHDIANFFCLQKYAPNQLNNRRKEITEI